MRRNLALTLVSGVALAVGLAASATAQHYSFCPFRSSALVSSCPPRLLFDIDGAVIPKGLPKRKLAPVALEIRGKISTDDGSHPSALREATIDLDKNGAIDAKGLPVCALRQLETRSTGAARRLCREAIVGSGVAHIGVEAPEQASIRAPLTLFNGGVKDGVTRLFIHGTIAMPNPAPIVTTVKIVKIQKGRYGLQSVLKVPRILDGSGSLLDFSFKIKRRFEYKGTKRSYVMARCFDGRLQAQFPSATFNDETGSGAKTTLTGTVIRPCTPMG
jgi:hypothetical protein